MEDDEAKLKVDKMKASHNKKREELKIQDEQKRKEAADRLNQIKVKMKFQG